MLTQIKVAAYPGGPIAEYWTDLHVDTATGREARLYLQMCLRRDLQDYLERLKPYEIIVDARRRFLTAGIAGKTLEVQHGSKE